SMDPFELFRWRRSVHSKSEFINRGWHPLILRALSNVFASLREPCPAKKVFAKAQRKSKDAKGDCHSMKLPFIVNRRRRVFRRAALAILLAPLLSYAQCSLVE